MRRIAFVLLVLLVFTIPWENMITLGRAASTIARLVGLLLAGLWIASVLLTGRFRRPHPLHLVAYVFLVWNALTLFWTVDIGRTLSSLQTLVQLGAMVFIAWDLVDTAAELGLTLQAYVLGAYVTIGGTVANYLAESGADRARYAPSGFNENNAGVIIALGIPVAWYLILSARSGKGASLLRAANYAYLPAGLLAIVLTASRAALVAAVPAVLFVTWSLQRLTVLRRSVAFAGLMLAMFLIQPLVPQRSVERLSTIGTSTGFEPLGRRVAIWQEGLGVFLERPLVGVGSGAFRAATEYGRAPHNFVLSLNTELGIIGFGLFAMVLCLAVYYALRQPASRSRLWLTVLSVWALAAATHNFEQKKPIWLFLSLVSVGAGLGERRDTPLAGSPVQRATDRTMGPSGNPWEVARKRETA